MALRICTIGCGGIATGRHGPSYARYASERPDTELVACCDLIEDRATAFRERFGFARHYTDLDEMLGAERPDAVCLVSPVDLTCELASHIFSLGYPLILEKPPGRTVEETNRLIAAAGALPNQVAFNRRHAPVFRRAVDLLREDLEPSGVQHIRYEVERVNRRDPDFSTTAIHGIDAVRFLARSDYAHIRFRYHEMPEIGPGVCNILLDAVMESGTTAHLSFCPVAGRVVERATIHAQDHTFLAHMAEGLDGTGMLRHVERGGIVLEAPGAEVADSDEGFVLEGFYGENASFFEDVREGRKPVDDLRSALQSAEVAEHIRGRQAEYRAP
jgi:predicted dehydrogenase